MALIFYLSGRFTCFAERFGNCIQKLKEKNELKDAVCDATKVE